ncbi:hypothetical protein [Methanocorpusculum sp.]
MYPCPSKDATPAGISPELSIPGPMRAASGEAAPISGVNTENQSLSPVSRVN